MSWMAEEPPHQSHRRYPPPYSREHLMFYAASEPLPEAGTSPPLAYTGWNPN